MSKELIALIDINKIIQQQRSLNAKGNQFFTDTEIVDAIAQYVNEYFVDKAKKNNSWVVCKSKEFNEDLHKLSTEEMAVKYNVSCQNIYYHKSKKLHGGSKCLKKQNLS